LPRGGLALDAAAGAGRHSLLLARAGFKVVAIDYAEAGLRAMQAAARAERLAAWPVVADLCDYPLPCDRFDLALNVSFLDRGLAPRLVASLKPAACCSSIRFSSIRSHSAIRAIPISCSSITSCGRCSTRQGWNFCATARESRSIPTA